jgi:thiol:disulfide interchange protein DsbC
MLARILALAALCLAVLPARADEAQIRKVIESKLDGARMNKLLAVKFDSLPMQDAVKIRRGSGRRVLAMFSDPYCPACQQFEKELARIDDITIYVFMYPVIHPELAEQSRAIWCSPDRSKAWLDLALRGKRPSANADCANPLERNLALGHRLGVNSTPTLFLANGERLRGGLSSAHLAATLDDVYREMKAAKVAK